MITLRPAPALLVVLVSSCTSLPQDADQVVALSPQALVSADDSGTRLTARAEGSAASSCAAAEATAVKFSGAVTSSGSVDSALITASVDEAAALKVGSVGPRDFVFDGRTKTASYTASVLVPIGRHRVTLCHVQSGAQGRAAKMTCAPAVELQIGDTVAPVLTMLGASPAAVECGASYVDEGATATDLCAGDLTSAIVTRNAVDASVEGAYTVSYAVSDPAGNAARTVRGVEVQDTLPPVLGLRGPAAVTVECGDSYLDPGATADDQCHGDLTDQVASHSDVNTGAVGSYAVSYQVADPRGHLASAKRRVSVVDTVAPLVASRDLALWPPNHQYQTLTLAHCAAAFDRCDGALDPNAAGTILSISSDEAEDEVGMGDGNTDEDIRILGPNAFEVRVEREGAGNGRVYTVRFAVSDAAGNVRPAVCRLTVAHDQNQPAIDDGAQSGYTVSATALP